MLPCVFQQGWGIRWVRVCPSILHAVQRALLSLFLLSKRFWVRLPLFAPVPTSLEEGPLPDDRNMLE